MSEIKRNDPCPCGSGKKYKTCHIGKALPGEERKTFPLLPLSLVIIAAGVAGNLKDIKTGLLVGGAGLVIMVLYRVLSNPPPPSGRGGGDAINFGR